MAKAKEVKEENSDQIEALLGSKDFKGLHYGSRSGTEIIRPDIISTGSFTFDEVLGGGFRACGWARFYSDPECGKTSMSLCWGKQWQDFYPKDGMVVAFNAEGRITADLIERSGISTEKDRFRIIDTNMSDAIWSLIENLVSDNPHKKRYFFIVDSTDACVRASDTKDKKEIGEAEKIGGTATILSAAGKRLSLIFNLKHHFLFMCSQVRDKVNTNSKAGGGKDASGGNAPKFYSSLTGQIKKPWTDKMIFENPSDTKSKPIGRFVEILLHKTPNEKTGVTVEYPVKYDHIGGVWHAYEAMILAQSWNYVVETAQSRYTFTDEFFQELKDNGIEVEQKYHGERKLRDTFDSCPELANFVLNKIKNLAR